MSRQSLQRVQKQLHVMKFGGTSVGDASAIRKVVDIVRGAACDSHLVVVVSAMSGVTNQLLEAARQAEAGDCDAVRTILDKLRERHRLAIATLIDSVSARSRVTRELEQAFQEGERLCQRTALRRELTFPTRDAISSLGERLSTPLVASALREYGLASEAIEATDLILTDSCHGCAEPRMDATREKCVPRLRPLLQKGAVPVVTGFIGATAGGVLTTLGRGGSDYSATILGAALDADEVTIWTDVDGLMTADPRMVPDAVTIAEISYREASELAHFGAKVLHPKTLGPVTHPGIPLWIRNTFAPEGPGTRITPAGPATSAGVKGLAAMNDVVLIRVQGSPSDDVELMTRAMATTTAVGVKILLTSQPSSENDFCLVVASSVAERAVEALSREFAPRAPQEKAMRVTFDANVAIVTLVGQNMRASATVVRALGALGLEDLKLIAIPPASSEFSVSIVVAKPDLRVALDALHREFRLGIVDSKLLSAVGPAVWRYGSEQQTTSAD